MNQITTTQPYFDKQGNFYFPNDIKFGGEVEPALRPNEWWFLVLTIADKEQISEEHQKELFDLVGCKRTLYRIKKSLKEKGYL